jgi:uncharacterized protein DUF5677
VTASKVPYFTKLDPALREDLRLYKAAQGVPEAEQIDRALRGWFNSRPDVTAAIASKYRNQLDAMAGLHDAVLGMMRSPWTIGKPGLNRIIFYTVIGLLTKACKTFKSIQVLCERGLHEDADALVRVLLETTAAILYILDDKSTERALIYHAHGMHQQLKMLKHWRKVPSLAPLATDERVEQAQAAFDSYMKRLPAGTDVSRHWSGLRGLEDVLKSLGDEVTYASSFRFSSAIIHGNDFGAHFEIDGASEGFDDLVWQIDPRVRGFEAPTYAARQLLWNTADRINTRFGLGFESKLAPFRLTDQDVQKGKK